MAWDFETDPGYQAKLDWADEFVCTEVEPLDLVWPHEQFVPLTGKRRDAIAPLKERVREQGLWATHLGPDLGGQGRGQVELALLNEILGRSSWAPIVFGCQAPDTANAEILAHFGSPEQKQRYLRPLLDGELFSCYSMTEPQAGADPRQFMTAAVRDGDDWVINGWKYFSSNARTAAFLIVMAITDPEAGAYKGMSTSWTGKWARSAIPNSTSPGRSRAGPRIPTPPKLLPQAMSTCGTCLPATRLSPASARCPAGRWTTSTTT
jgi:acyl-CoA dehydrogenase